MDSENMRWMQRMLGGDTDGKLSLLMDYTDHPRSVADPWYTGDFKTTYRDIVEGCTGLLKTILTER
jgi:protein-tyrosine phosphatase